jgi:hypothetical protein
MHIIAVGSMSTDSEPLFRWGEAEADATKTLELCPRNLKALLRRGKARKELGKWDQARVGKDSSEVLSVSTSLKADQSIRHSDVH